MQTGRQAPRLQSHAPAAGMAGTSRACHNHPSFSIFVTSVAEQMVLSQGVSVVEAELFTSFRKGYMVCILSWQFSYSAGVQQMTFTIFCDIFGVFILEVAVCDKHLNRTLSS